MNLFYWFKSKYISVCQHFSRYRKKQWIIVVYMVAAIFIISPCLFLSMFYF